MNDTRRTFVPGVIFGVLALVAGTATPLLTALIFSVPLVNVIWGFAFSFILLAWRTAFGDPGFGVIGFLYAVIGAFLWPIFVAVLASILFGINSYRKWAVGLFGLSLLVVLPASYFSGALSFIAYLR
jgi:hypothetical protein